MMQNTRECGDDQQSQATMYFNCSIEPKVLLTIGLLESILYVHHIIFEFNLCYPRASIVNRTGRYIIIQGPKTK